MVSSVLKSPASNSFIGGVPLDMTVGLAAVVAIFAAVVEVVVVAVVAIFMPCLY